MRGVAAFASVLPALLILFLAQTYRNFWNVEVQNTRSVPILLRQADKMKLEMIGVMSGEASEAALGEADSRPAMAPPTSRDARGLEPEYRQEENTSVTSGRGAVGPARFPAKDPIQQPSIHCNHSSLQAINACLAEHDMPKSFPDFIIIGWAKSSTTGLFYHLGDHPEVIKPTKKVCRWVALLSKRIRGELPALQQKRWRHANAGTELLQKVQPGWQLPIQWHT